MSTPTLSDLIEMRMAIPPVPEEAKKASLSDRFIVPPFSVLDARQGYWQKRKKMWLDVGMTYGMRATDGGNHSFSRAVETRQGGNFFGYGEQGSGKRGDIGRYTNTSKRKAGKCFNMGMDGGDAEADDNKRYSTPVFDPVLCELSYRWFCPSGGHIVDPFAGTALSGIVATKLGRRFTGIDINPLQVEQNRVECEALCSEKESERLDWIHGDSADAVRILCSNRLTGKEGGKCDLLFSCPPYGDLVQYSDDPRDISTMEYQRFLTAYQRIISETCKCLRDDRFAVYVIGDFRDPKTGYYRGFIGDTIDAHRAAGLELYNDIVLITAVGSLPLRVGKQFTGSRKTGKAHQNVLVFLKGNAERAATACGEVDVDNLEMPECRAGTIALEAEGGKVEVLDMPMVEAALTCDIVRGDDREQGKPISRVWTCTKGDGWIKIQDYDELTYVIGGKAYLNQSVFSDSKGPSDTPPTPRKLR